MEIKCNAVLKDGIGKKSGKPYVAVEVTLPDGYKLVMFPQNHAERYVFEKNLQKGDNR